MGLFDKVFKNQRDISKEEIKEVPWHALTEEEQIENIIAESKDKTIAIFKHSTRCGISRMVLKNFERSYDICENPNHKLYFLDLLANREVSNRIAERLDVQHESPQLIVLKEGKVVEHASHHSIELELVKKHL